MRDSRKSVTLSQLRGSRLWRRSTLPSPRTSLRCTLWTAQTTSSCITTPWGQWLLMRVKCQHCAHCRASERNAGMEKMAEQIATLCSTLGEYPSIRYRAWVASMLFWPVPEQVWEYPRKYDTKVVGVPQKVVMNFWIYTNGKLGVIFTCYTNMFSIPTGYSRSAQNCLKLNTLKTLNNWCWEYSGTCSRSGRGNGLILWGSCEGLIRLIISITVTMTEIWS